MHDHVATVIKCIDFFNANTNDCFYTLPYQELENIFQVDKTTVKGDGKEREQVFFSVKEDLYPYLLINIRSGANFIRVDGPEEYSRVSGTALGASTFVGILKLLYNIDDPTEMLFGCIEGKSAEVDMSVGDIYGDCTETLGLPPGLIASSFGKLKDMSQEEVKELRPADVSRSLITMILFNTLLLANLVGEKEKLNRFVMVGAHMTIPELEIICEMGFKFASGKNLNFVRYSSFLGSMGLLTQHGLI